LTPEARARQSIDALLVAAGCAVQDLMHANIHSFLGVAILQRAKSLRQAISAKAFAS
jgi:hypothetical protein